MDRPRNGAQGVQKRDPGDDNEPSLEDVMREQEELAAVDTTIAETIDVMNTGRESVAQRFYRQESSGQPGDSTHPLDIIKTGRRRILERLAQRNEQHEADGGEATLSDEEWMGELNRQLVEKLYTLTSTVPQDRAQKQMLEAEIQAAVRSYLNSVHKILNPLRFSRQVSRPGNNY